MSSEPVTPDSPQNPNVHDPTDDDSSTYARVFATDDALPAPAGPIAKLFQAIPPEAQRADAQALYEFFNTNGNPLRLNVGTKLLSALVIVPETSNVTLIYGLGYGTADIGENSPIADKYLALCGEGSAELGPPELRILPANLSTESEFLCPSDEDVQTSLTDKGRNYGAHLIAPRNVQELRKEKLLRIAPIPSYFVFDAFENALDAALVYERLLACSHESSMLSHAKAFLRTALVGPFRASDVKPYVNTADWTALPPSLAKEWRRERITTLFPSLFPSTPTHSAPTQATPAASTELFASLLREFQASVVTPSNTPLPNKPEASTSGSEFEKNLLKIMCGHDIACDDTVLPQWYASLFQKNQDRKDKDHIVGALLARKSRFEDVTLPVYPELKKMILERNWVGGEAGGSPKYAYACYGLSPFAMLDLTEDQIAEMEFTDSYLLASSSIAPSDIKSSKAKLKATVPACSVKWLNMLKRYTNLLFLLFTPSSPLYLKCLEIIKAIWEYPAEVITQLSHHAKASILWIIHLQSRHFAQGHMLGDGTSNKGCLPAFAQMFHLLCSSRIHLVSVAGLPLKLAPATSPGLLPDKDKSTNPAPGSPDTEPLAKKRKTQEELPWNPKLKNSLAQPLKVAKSPGLAQLKQYCGLAAGDPILPNTATTDCRHYLLLGCCRFGATCKFNHGTASDEQAEVAIKKLEKFIKAPEGLRGK